VSAVKVNREFTVEVRKDQDGISQVWCDGPDWSTVTESERLQIAKHVHELLVSKGYNLSGVYLAPRTVIDGSLILWD
jgi:hypothetical protein